VHIKKRRRVAKISWRGERKRELAIVSRAADCSSHVSSLSSVEARTSAVSRSLGGATAFQIMTESDEYISVVTRHDRTARYFAVRLRD
jgi:hypothetical protein